MTNAKQNVECQARDRPGSDSARCLGRVEAAGARTAIAALNANSSLNCLLRLPAAAPPSSPVSVAAPFLERVVQVSALGLHFSLPEYALREGLSDLRLGTVYVFLWRIMQLGWR
jgi:hypothetical protein